MQLLLRSLIASKRLLLLWVCSYNAASAVAGMNTWKFLKLSMLIWLDCLSLMSPTDLGAIQGWFRHSATDPRLLELKRGTVNKKIFRPCRSITAFQSRVHQCSGSESGSTGSTRFLAPRIRIRILDSYCFVTSFGLFILAS